MFIVSVDFVSGEGLKLECVELVFMLLIVIVIVILLKIIGVVLIIVFFIILVVVVCRFLGIFE